MSTYSSLLKTSNSFERLFKILTKVFLIMTVVLVVIGRFAVGYFSSYLPDEVVDRVFAILYIMSPAAISLVLTVASFVASKIAYNIRLDLPAESK